MLYPRRGQISFTCQRKPEVRHKMFSMPLLSGWYTQTFRAARHHPKEDTSTLLCCLLVQCCFYFHFLYFSTEICVQAEWFKPCIRYVRGILRIWLRHCHRLDLHSSSWLTVIFSIYSNRLHLESSSRFTVILSVYIQRFNLKSSLGLSHRLTLSHLSVYGHRLNLHSSLGLQSSLDLQLSSRFTVTVSIYSRRFDLQSSTRFTYSVQQPNQR